MPDADLKYYPNFIAASEAAILMQALHQSLDWRQEQITLYGKTFDVPRLQAWYGDKNARYQYSNLSLRPLPWNSVLLALKQKCENTSNSHFNSVLANLYRHGQDGMGRHADNEPELGQQPVIASLSFGEERNLDFYHNATKDKVRLPLHNGSLLVMSGNTQKYWQHGVAKTKKTLAPRINLTFRYIQI
jgi:alkylated DNA repair dioxygenase AlkB